MVDFLCMCLRYGVSFVVAGATSSGKTTMLNALLSTIPDNKRIFSIESGLRELSLVRRFRSGKVTSLIRDCLVPYTKEVKIFMVSGHLQVKKGYYYVVVSYYDSLNKKHVKYISTGLEEKGNKRKAEKELARIRNELVPPKDLKDGELDPRYAFR